MSSSHCLLAPMYVPEFSQTAHRYYNTHFRFIVSILDHVGCRIEYFKPNLKHDCSRSLFYCWFDGLRVLFDISDYHAPPTSQETRSVEAVFKFHPNPDDPAASGSLVFPFSPISFYDWVEYRRLRNTIKYRSCGTILSNQRPHTQNRERRTFVQELLANRYASEFDNSCTSQLQFWQKINEALVSVCVPGARLDILDRGQLQYMALGACTLSPPISVALPFGERLIAGKHYLQCRPDWADLIERIEWVRDNSAQCIDIGFRAKELFETRLSPQPLFMWLLKCMNIVIGEQ